LQKREQTGQANQPTANLNEKNFQDNKDIGTAFVPVPTGTQRQTADFVTVHSLFIIFCDTNLANNSPTQIIITHRSIECDPAAEFTIEAS